MFGWITHCSLTAILNYVNRILVFKTKYEKHFELCLQILNNSKFKIQKFKISNSNFKTQFKIQNLVFKNKEVTKWQISPSLKYKIKK